MVDGFSVLIVCTANQCRSPMAEHILRARVEEADLDWYVSSAGTHAVERSAIVPEASRILARRGIDATGFHSRRLTGELIAGADLILTAEQKQRERVAALMPGAIRRTFTLRQFARLVDNPARDGVPMTGPDLVELALEVQGLSQPDESDDLADPVGGPRRGYRQCAELIDEALDLILGY